MKRLRNLFAGVLLLLSLPVWRYIDLVAIASPVEFFLTLALVLWFSLFLLVPLKLFRPQTKPLIFLLLFLCFGSLAWTTAPVSKMATDDPTFNHCGSLTFTAAFYPLRTILTDAYHDDLEARNQMCWIRKMITRVSTDLDSDDERETYSRLVQDKLLRPEIKYRASLPLIAFLYFKINSSGANITSAKNIYDSFHFWIQHYTEEISNRQYAWWNWPHSNYIRFEYGLVEKNWQYFVDGIVLR